MASTREFTGIRNENENWKTNFSSVNRAYSQPVQHKSVRMEARSGVSYPPVLNEYLAIDSGGHVSE